MLLADHWQQTCIADNTIPIDDSQWYLGCPEANVSCFCDDYAFRDNSFTCIEGTCMCPDRDMDAKLLFHVVNGLCEGKQ